MEISTIEVAGFASALKALRLPFKKEARSEFYTAQDGWQRDKGSGMICYGGGFSVCPEDLKLIQTLILRGDEHAKPLRGIMVWAEITAPIYFWWDLETYGVGRQRLFSESTMHEEGRSLRGRALQAVLNGISFGRPIRKIDCFSYQTLRRIVAQRHDHRKPEFHGFIEWVRTLPMAEELILVGLEDKMKVHEEMLRDYECEV